MITYYYLNILLRRSSNGEGLMDIHAEKLLQ